MMIYNSGKEEKKGDCCGKCIHFCAVCKVSDIDKKFLIERYKNVYTGYCDLKGPGEDIISHELQGAEKYRWATHIPCLDFDDE